MMEVHSKLLWLVMPTKALKMFQLISGDYELKQNTRNHLFQEQERLLRIQEAVLHTDNHFLQEITL